MIAGAHPATASDHPVIAGAHPATAVDHRVIAGIYPATLVSALGGRWRG
jgi:hypothetical protein